MNDRETLFLLSDSRENISQSIALLRRIGAYDPDLLRKELPRMNALAGRQLRLERKAQMQAPQLGWVVPVVMGGMALLGIGGGAFKHHEETALERYKLESIDKCIEENVKSGMQRQEASRVCGQLFGGKDLANTLTELSKTIMIGSLAIAGVYVVIKWRK